MDERAPVERLIAEIVRDARLGSERERDELRRELESHFADASSSSGAGPSAIERFGNPAAVSSDLRAVHRATGGIVRALRIASAVAISAIVALSLQLGANLQVPSHGSAVRIGGGFLYSAIFSGLIIVVLVLAWELDIEALCTRLEREPIRLVLTVLIMAMAMMLVHALHDTSLAPAVATRASAVDVAIWTSTVAILVKTDRLFVAAFRRRAR